MSVWTIVVAAGSGTRFGGLKQFEPLGTRRVVDWSVAAAEASSDGVVVVVPAECSEPGTIAGGPTRSASVARGLAAVPKDATIVLVHDGSRPFASEALFDRVIAAVRAGVDGAIPGLPVTDTIKRVDANGAIVATVDRTDLRAVQTPQAFDARSLRAAYASGSTATDDAAVVEAAGGRVVVVNGEPDNRKITTPEDLAWARAKVSPL